jgi:hypothetical protein
MAKSTFINQKIWIRNRKHCPFCNAYVKFIETDDGDKCPNCKTILKDPPPKEKVDKV